MRAGQHHAKDELEAILSANEFRKRKTSVLILFNKMDIEDTPNIAELETVLRLSQMRQQQRNIDMHLQACTRSRIHAYTHLDSGIAGACAPQPS